MSKLLKSTMARAETNRPARPHEMNMIMPAILMARLLPDADRLGIPVAFQSERADIIPVQRQKPTRVEFDPRPPVRWGINE